MRITNKNGKIITDLQTWEEAFKEVDAGPKHWKEQRSAHSLAVHFTNPTINQSNGEKKLVECMKLFGFENVSLDHAEIEHESRFDKYRGNGRIQDMIIWAKIDNLPAVICVEAKVDESFDENISDAYESRKETLKNKPNSKAAQRLEDLCHKYYGNSIIEELKDIRYQLLYYLAGSITEAKKIDGIVFMPIFVYRTNKYDDKIGKRNKNDYVKFMNSLEFENLSTPEDKILRYKKRFEETDVYSAYIEVDL